MRWPFTPRARYDELAHQLTAEIREAERARVDAESRERQQERRHTVELSTMVPRAVLDGIIAQRDTAEQHARAQEQHHAAALAHRDGLIAREAARVDALTKVILRMKEHGAVLLPPASVQAQRKAEEARTPTPIEKAIDDNARARANPALRSRLRAFAKAEEAKGTKPDAILTRLRTWNDPTHDEDDAEEDAFS